MVNGDVLSVVNKGEVFKDIDLNAHMHEAPEAFAANSNFLDIIPCGCGHLRAQ